VNLDTQKVKGSFRIADQFGVVEMKINQNFIYRKKKNSATMPQS
jgi:hypothetical protein